LPQREHAVQAGPHGPQPEQSQGHQNRGGCDGNDGP
jgi:hypothetical protein